ncbi:MAG: ribonuclease domain-containing protein [Bulleidia sp.]
MKRFLPCLLACLLYACGPSGTPDSTASAPAASIPAATESSSAEVLPEDTTCDDQACVTEYLITYDHLPDNYMTKKEARTYGWEGGPLWKVVPGRSIGGDVFGNYEEQLPEVSGRTYYECDLNTIGADSRGSERLIYSSGDLNIYYTQDHYDSFELVYGDDE